MNWLRILLIGFVLVGGLTFTAILTYLMYEVTKDLK